MEQKNLTPNLLCAITPQLTYPQFSNTLLFSALLFSTIEGKVSNETVVLRRWEV